MSMTKESYENFQQDNEDHFIEKSKKIVWNIEQHLNAIKARGR